MTSSYAVSDAGAHAPPVPAGWSGSAPIPIDADKAFNGFVAANVIHALDRLGLLERLEGGTIDVAAFRVASNADARLLGELLRIAATLGYVRLSGSSLLLTEAGQEIARMRGYFTWAVGGYSALFAGTAEMTTGGQLFGVDIHRNEAMVALGSGENDRSFLADILDEALADVEFNTLADLGSGTSARVSRVVAGRPGTRGLGLDISGPVTRLAARSVEEAGLADRVRPIQADVLDVCLRAEHRDALANVDTVMSFFLLHDLLADPVTRPLIITRLRDAFPRARTFLLADTVLRPDDGCGQLPIFTAGFELAHALMGVPLHTRQTYERLFADAGLRLRGLLPFGTPNSWLFVLDAT